MQDQALQHVPCFEVPIGIPVATIDDQGIGDERRILFQPGEVNEFSVTCADVGDITAVTVMHDNDGYDWNSSRWKLERIVITCLQDSPHHSVATTPAGGGLKSSANQWQFVLEQKWLGCTTGRDDAESRLREEFFWVQFH